MNNEPKISDEFKIAQQRELEQKNAQERAREEKLQLINDQNERDKIHEMIEQRNKDMKSAKDDKQREQEEANRRETQKRVDSNKQLTPIMRGLAGKTPSQIANEVKRDSRLTHEIQMAAHLGGVESILNKEIDKALDKSLEIQQDHERQERQMFQKPAEKSPDTISRPWESNAFGAGNDRPWENKLDRDR